MTKPDNTTLHELLKGLGLILFLFTVFNCTPTEHNGSAVKVKKDSRIILLGNNLGSRMLNFGTFETEMYMRYPDSNLMIRNMCDPGNTPGFRPHSSRNSPWAFPGAEEFQTELANPSGSTGHFETPDEWMTRLETDIIIAFFGYSESFEGQDGLENYKAELDAFVSHTLSQKYNGKDTVQLVLVSPIAFEDLSDDMDVPNGEEENKNLSMYTEAMKEVAQNHNLLFVDAFAPSQDWYNNSAEPLTIDGSQLNAEGYNKLGKYLADQIFGEKVSAIEGRRNLVHKAVMEKNWMWHNDYKIPNGVHAYGRRYNPFGPDNYPYEIAKIREMTSIRDTAIWMAASKGEKMDLATADKKTDTLPDVETNYRPSRKNGTVEYLYGEDALEKVHVPEGYKIELFASEEEFSELANPVQMSFDNKGRLWVATMPSYPHYKPGDQKPNDKLIILEDTDNDGKADNQIVFADSLHLPVGFELAPEGVYISQGTNMKLLMDTDGDDHADKEEILLSGFDDHDTHHAHSAYTADPSGAIYMGEGVFLHTNVETSYGTVRGTNGGFYRFNPQRRRLERTAQLPIPNPWGIAFDRWGQNFFAHTSGPDVRWMMPGTVLPYYGEANHNSYNLIEEAHRVRPTSGLEFVSSRHFPDEVQGDLLINNTIGFLGMKQHVMEDDGTGYVSHHRVDLVKGDDGNFRPVDMEFAPDGSLYFIDWHNVLIGHMQHNARDPLRDHSHGRVYRVTYPSRPLVEPAEVDGASIQVLLDNLKLPEYRTRYRTRRELRGRDASEVLPALKEWVSNLDTSDPNYEHQVLEALWVSWGLNKVDKDLLVRMLNAEDYHARAAAVRVLRYTGHQVDNQTELMTEAARDEHGRVRLEAIVAASWMEPEEGNKVLDVAGQQPMDKWIIHSYETAVAHLNGESVESRKKGKEESIVPERLNEEEGELFTLGKEIYSRDGFCITCHQEDGNGLETSGFPPLSGTKWVQESEERLVKIILKGMMGPIEVKGKSYPGQVPMTPFEGMLSDKEVAAVATYVRNSFGNESSVVTPELVEKVRESVENKQGFYSSEDLLKEHPME
ncbi:PVC-type heme-binding CxxCH protein [Membranihabitans maritimus]|uniref:PVC-type heme-binding CxxCH protein n=1 Tax=Membranihabitans maritimus TaxID=2904244 RepID=UPI001F002289|nr:PVC-type heme-binding CxxCH protein [Membranihabitans maritimus]